MKMLRKSVSAVLVLVLLVSALAFAPAALADDYYSSYTTLAGSSAAKIANIDLAVASLDGVYVPYGGTFSFNDIVGPRTKAAGYRTAVNGRGAQVVGGGVSQVATTLYLALRDVSGIIQFGEIATYGDRFKDNYVSDSDLAIITDYNAGYDLSFTNYAGNLYIEMWENGKYLYCSLTVSPVSGGGSGGWSSGGSGGGSSSDWFSDWSTPSTMIASASIHCGYESNVLHNVDQAAGCVYDTTLYSGDTFSFNSVVGPRTSAYGYLNATNGRGVKVVGGGVAQVASVIWLAVKGRSDIAIIEKTTYGERYNQSYVANSSDAIVTDYNAGTDFSFRYTGTGSITIYTTLEKGVLTCEIYK